MLTRKAFIYNNMMAAGSFFASRSLLSEVNADEKLIDSPFCTMMFINIDPFLMDGG
jgi:hypothetical protein